MKKIIAIAFCMLLLGSLFLTIGTAMAFTSGYELTEYFAPAAVTVDGKWTTATEWSATVVNYMGTPQKGLFMMMMDATGAYSPSYCIEFADNTNDAGDIIQVCMNGGTDSATPRAGEDFKMEIQGSSTVKVYQGTGTGWAETTNSAVQAAVTITTSAHDPAPHKIAEFKIDKAALAAWGANPPPEGVRIAMYDASKPAQGWVAWPPTSTANNPSSWGVINNYSMDPAPEGLTVGVMLALSTIAVIVSVRYFRKQPKTYRAVKL